MGCESYHPNPELLDPIFKEYSEKAGENKKEIELIDKIIEQSELELLDEKPTKIKRMAVIADLNRLKEEKRLFTQKKRYFTIKAKKRAAYVRRRTIANINVKRSKSEEKQELWDQNQEFEHYKTNQRLRSAPKTWDHRVPKLYPEDEF